AVLSKGSGKWTRDGARLALLYAQPRTIHGVSRVGQRLGELLNGPIILRQGHAYVFFAADDSFGNEAPPQRINGVEHMDTACVLPCLVLAEIDQHQPTAWLQLTCSLEEDGFPVPLSLLGEGGQFGTCGTESMDVLGQVAGFAAEPMH